MKLRPTLQSAGLLVDKESVGVQTVRLGTGVPARVRRVARVARSILVASSQRVGIEAASLTLDGVRPTALPVASKGVGSIYRWRGFDCLEWRADDPPRLERRALHPRTMLLLHTKGALQDDVELNLLNDLRLFLDAEPAYDGFARDERVIEFERDLLCWWFENLPMPLFFHASGLQALSAVTRACLASADSDRVPDLVKVEADALTGPRPGDDSCAELLDVMNLADGPDASPGVLKQALAHISLENAESDAAAKRRWIEALLGLRMIAARTGPITALLLGWAVDLVESGTIRQPNPTKGTPYTYLRKALLPLFDALRALEGLPDTWSTDVLADTYDVLVGMQSAGSRGTMASALTNFHAFLQNWFDVEPLARPLYGNVPLPEVRSVVIWEHQMRRARSWIPSITGDERLAEAIDVVLAIGCGAPSRMKELTLLRLGNIADHSDFIEVEIAPSARHGRLKSTASQRRLQVRDPERMAVIRRKVQQVRALGLGPNTLLFSDPLVRSNVYRRAHLSRAISRILSAATGDAKAVGHSLRHASISLLNEPVLLTSSVTGINRFREVAVIAGHATGTTTFTSYTHLYEPALRQWLDAALARHVTLHSREAAAVAGIGEAALRQRACRLRTDTALLGWSLIRQSAEHLDVPDAGATLNLIAVRAPQSMSQAPATFGPSITLMLLKHMSAGSSPAEVAASFHLDEGKVRRLHGCAISVVKMVADSIWVRRGQDSPPISLADALQTLRLDLGRAEHKKFARIREWLQHERSGKLLDNATRSWLECRKGQHLRLDQSMAAYGLYRLLSEAGVDVGQLRVCVRRKRAGDLRPDVRPQVERDFVSAFRIKPRVQEIASRDRGPEAHLQFDSSDSRNRPRARAGSLQGLDALMLAIAIHQSWMKGEFQ